MFGYLELQEAASEKDTVYPGGSEKMRPAIFLPDELERISGVSEFAASFDDEMHLITREYADHGPTVAYRLRDVALYDGRICTFRRDRNLTFGRSSAGIRLLPEIADCAALCSTHAGNDYFAHFILDDICTALIGRAYGSPYFANTGHPRARHESEYLSALNIEHRDVPAGFFRDLWIFTDYSQNNHRKERLNTMRTALLARVRKDQCHSKPVYIRRGHSGRHRILENEAEIEELLEARGFIIVDPERESLDQISAKLAGCPMVVGVEGSQLAHGVLHLKDGSVLLCIQPAARFNAVYRSFTNTMGLDWAFVVADGGARQFRLDPDRLLATIDLAMA